MDLEEGNKRQAILLEKSEADRVEVVNRTKGDIVVVYNGVPTRFPPGVKKNLSRLKGAALCRAAVSRIDPATGFLTESFFGIEGDNDYPCDPLPYTQAERAHLPRAIVVGAVVCAIGPNSEPIPVGRYDKDGNVVPMQQDKFDKQDAEIKEMRKSMARMEALIEGLAAPAVELPSALGHSEGRKSR